jgi:hypothetical protein
MKFRMLAILALILIPTVASAQTTTTNCDANGQSVNCRSTTNQPQPTTTNTNCDISGQSMSCRSTTEQPSQPSQPVDVTPLEPAARQLGFALGGAIRNMMERRRDKNVGQVLPQDQQRAKDLQQANRSPSYRAYVQRQQAEQAAQTRQKDQADFEKQHPIKEKP